MSLNTIRVFLFFKLKKVWNKRNVHRSRRLRIDVQISSYCSRPIGQLRISGVPWLDKGGKPPETTDGNTTHMKKKLKIYLNFMKKKKKNYTLRFQPQNPPSNTVQRKKRLKTDGDKKIKFGSQKKQKRKNSCARILQKKKIKACQT